MKTTRKKVVKQKSNYTDNMLSKPYQLKTKCWADGCERQVVITNENCIKMLCHIHTTMLSSYTGNVTTKEKKPTGFPRGWKFMKEFVDAEKNVYHSGKLMPELKGTLEPTVIVKKSKQELKKKKEERQAKKETKALALFNKKKTALKKEKIKETKKRIYNEIFE